MTRVFAYLIRFAVIILGYAIAALTASAFINMVFLESQDFTPEQAPWIGVGALIFSVPFAALFVAYFAFIPSLTVILATEVLSRRDWLTYALSGGGIGLAVALFVRHAAEPGNDAVHDPQVLAAVVGAGIAGGIAYWAVAGRRAGGWLADRGPTSPAP